MIALLALAATTAPASQPADSHASRILHNFVQLMGNQWASMLSFVGWVILKSILWGLGLLIVGVVVGVLIHRYLRRRGAFEAPWPWYRYVRWLWAALLILGGGLGFGYAGLWIGAGRCIKGYIVGERALDKMVSHPIPFGTRVAAIKSGEKRIIARLRIAPGRAVAHDGPP